MAKSDTAKQTAETQTQTETDLSHEEIIDAHLDSVQPPTPEVVAKEQSAVAVSPGQTVSAPPASPIPDDVVRDAFGNPVMKSDGTGYRKKPGRKKVKPQPAQPEQPAPEEVAAQAQGVSDLVGMPNEALSHLVVTAYTGTLQGLFGPVFEPSESERTNMTEALTVYLDSVGANVPPWVGLTLAFGVYTGSRFALHAESRQKLKRMLGGKSEEAD